MKQKFKMVGKDETTIALTVEISTSKYVLTRDEQRRLKAELQNAAYRILRDQGYDFGQIKQARA